MFFRFSMNGHALAYHAASLPDRATQSRRCSSKWIIDVMARISTIVVQRHLHSAAIEEHLRSWGDHPPPVCVLCSTARKVRVFPCAYPFFRSPPLLCSRPPCPPTP